MRQQDPWNTWKRSIDIFNNTNYPSEVIIHLDPTEMQEIFLLYSFGRSRNCLAYGAVKVTNENLIYGCEITVLAEKNMERNISCTSVLVVSLEIWGLRLLYLWFGPNHSIQSFHTQADGLKTYFLTLIHLSSDYSFQKGGFLSKMWYKGGGRGFLMITWW